MYGNESSTVKVVVVVVCLAFQQHASVSLERICSDTGTEDSDQTFHLNQSQYTDMGWLVKHLNFSACIIFLASLR